MDKKMEKTSNVKNVKKTNEMTLVKGKADALDFGSIDIEWSGARMMLYLGVCVRLVDEDDFMDRSGVVDDIEKEAYIQKLSRYVRGEYEENQSLSTTEMVEYKDGGVFIFGLNRVEVMETSGGYFVVVYYDYNGSAS